MEGEKILLFNEYCFLVTLQLKQVSSLWPIQSGLAVKTQTLHNKCI